MSINSISSSPAMMMRLPLGPKAEPDAQAIRSKTAQTNSQPETSQNDAAMARRRAAAAQNSASPTPLTEKEAATVLALTPKAAQLADQLTNATSLSELQAKPAADAPGTNITTEPVADVQEAPDDAGGYPMLTLKGLLAAWGQENSPYDLSGDGTVGVSDMLILLQNGGTMPMPEGTQEPLTLAGLMAAWGQNHPTFDLNGDGTVDTSDLLILLAQLGNGQNDPQESNSQMLTESQLPDSMTKQSLLELVQANPNATDESVRTLMAMLGEKKQA